MLTCLRAGVYLVLSAQRGGRPGPADGNAEKRPLRSELRDVHYPTRGMLRLLARVTKSARKKATRWEPKQPSTQTQPSETQIYSWHTETCRFWRWFMASVSATWPAARLPRADRPPAEGRAWGAHHEAVAVEDMAARLCSILLFCTQAQPPPWRAKEAKERNKKLDTRAVCADSDGEV